MSAIEPVIAIHGGTVHKREDHPSDLDNVYKSKLREILQLGISCLRNGGSALDAVELCVQTFENCDLFDCGRGSVLDENGRVFMDASIMDGRTLKAGAVAYVNSIRNPVSAARLVMERSNCVMLVENMAVEQFLRSIDKKNLLVSPAYFYCEREIQCFNTHSSKATGTVGCVARDSTGTLAAATSTGGLNLKLAGRVGDSPIVGSGNYANDQSCAISCTGIGDFFIRTVAAHEVHALLKYKNLPLSEAMIDVLKQIEMLGGRGGMIGIDHQGNIAIERRSVEGMYRGFAKNNMLEVAIF